MSTSIQEQVTKLLKRMAGQQTLIDSGREGVIQVLKYVGADHAPSLKAYAKSYEQQWQTRQQYANICAQFWQAPGQVPDSLQVLNRMVIMSATAVIVIRAGLGHFTVESYGLDGVIEKPSKGDGPKQYHYSNKSPEEKATRKAALKELLAGNGGSFYFLTSFPSEPEGTFSFNFAVSASTTFANWDQLEVFNWMKKDYKAVNGVAQFESSVIGFMQANHGGWVNTQSWIVEGGYTIMNFLLAVETFGESAPICESHMIVQKTAEATSALFPTVNLEGDELTLLQYMVVALKQKVMAQDKLAELTVQKANLEESQLA
jgi:hypothetical protein